MIFNCTIINLRPYRFFAVKNRLVSSVVPVQVIYLSSILPMCSQCLPQFFDYVLFVYFVGRTIDDFTTKVTSANIYKRYSIISPFSTRKKHRYLYRCFLTLLFFYGGKVIAWTGFEPATSSL